MKQFQFEAKHALVVASVFAMGLMSASVEAQPYYNSQPYPVHCYSQDYRPNRCALGGQVANVVLMQQISNNKGPCIQGQTWGWDYNGIWVQNGCRGAFAVYPYGYGGGHPGYPGYPGNGPGNGGGGHGGGRGGDGRGGHGGGRGGDGRGGHGGGRGGDGRGGHGGGRGGHLLANEPMNAAGGVTLLTCLNENNETQNCDVDGVIQSVQLERQISDNGKACVEGKTWGYDESKVWITDGCQAEFRVDFK